MSVYASGVIKSFLKCGPDCSCFDAGWTSRETVQVLLLFSLHLIIASYCMLHGIMHTIKTVLNPGLLSFFYLQFTYCFYCPVYTGHRC